MKEDNINKLQNRNKRQYPRFRVRAPLLWEKIGVINKHSIEWTHRQSRSRSCNTPLRRTILCCRPTMIIWVIVRRYCSGGRCRRLRSSCRRHSLTRRSINRTLLWRRRIRTPFDFEYIGRFVVLVYNCNGLGRWSMLLLLERCCCDGPSCVKERERGVVVKSTYLYYQSAIDI